MKRKTFLAEALFWLLLLAVSIVFGAVQAAEREVITSPRDAREKLNRDDLLQSLKEKGRVRVVVGLQTREETERRGDLAADNEKALAVTARQARLLKRLEGRNVREIRRLRLHQFMVLNVDAAALDALLADPEVTSIAVDRPRYQVLHDTPNITRATDAWAAGIRGSGQVVAVIDSGVDSTHPLLSGKVLAEACFSNPVGTNTSYCPAGAAHSVVPGSGAACPDYNQGCWHGTHVAGIVAGRDGSLGGAPGGIAPDAGIVAIQVFQRSCSTCPIEAYDSDILAALEHVYSLRNTFNIAAVNLSLAGDVLYAAPCDGTYPAYKSVIDNLRGANIATVVSAGNHGNPNALAAPACMSNAIAVGATTKNNGVAEFSNNASFLSLLAPGAAILSSAPTAFVASGLGTASGTSAAAAHVAGAWALLKSASPSATVSGALAALQGTGLPITDTRSGVVKPLIQIGDAAVQLSALGTPVGQDVPPSVALTSPAGGASFTAPANITLTATATATRSSISRVEFYSGANKIHEMSAAPYSFVWTGVASGAYTLTARAVGSAGTVESRPINVWVNPAVATGQSVQRFTAAAGDDIVWVEDALPAGATAGTNGVEAWTWVSANPAPFSGALAHQSTLASGNHQHYFFGATATLSVGVGDTLFAYVYLDPANPPSEIMLGWNDGSWEHRAYWGANVIPWGVDGTAGRRYMGPLPATGQWVRLEVPAALVGLEGSTLNGMAHILYDGRATWDRAGKAAAAPPPTYQVSGTVTLSGAGLTGVSIAATNGVSCSNTNASGQYSCTVQQGWTGTVTPALSGHTFAPPSRSYSNVTANQTAQNYAGAASSDVVWVEDALPAGATAGTNGVEAWTWVSANPAPFSGASAHQSTLASGNHQHYFFDATATLSVGVGDTLFAYVYLDPANPPSEIMLGWNDGSWEHRAYWGANVIPWGVDGTAGRRYMGPLPATGQWVRLEVPAALVGLEGSTLNGMAHILYDGRATWDRAGKVASAPLPTYQVSGTVTLSGVGLTGVSIAATNGVSCSNTNASGQYSCTVPQGWTGTVTPSLSGYMFTPPLRSYSNVTANQAAQNYTAAASTDIVWVEDAMPAGATAFAAGGDAWTWVSANPTPFSGALAHQSSLASGSHQHYFSGATATLSVGVGDVLFAYVYLDPANPPSEVMLQWNDGTWEHRAYWGANLLAYGAGVDGTASQRYMGPLPAAGQWVRLEVPAALVGLEGRTLNGMAYSLYGGRATWDRAGKASLASTFVVSGTVTLSGSGLGGVSMTATNGVSCSNTNASGQYSCTVPQGWTGTVTPALAGHTFAPPSRSYSNVTANQTAQNYAGAASSDVVWVEDALPAGATAGTNGVEAWTWVSANPAPFSGALAHQSTLASGNHQHYFFGATATLSVGVGDTLFAYVYLDPANPPSEIMLGWNDGSWEHRAYWGANVIPWGVDGTAGRRYMGPLPATGQWVRLEVPAALVGLEGSTLNGMAHILYDGRATWDRAGKAAAAPPPTYQVSGTVTLSGAGLTGVSMAATNGVSCSNTNASGQYSCTVQQGWTGTVTPALAGHTFAPPSRSYSNVTANQTAQNYAGAASSDVVWVEDALPAGATAGTNGVEAWTWVSANPAPFSGALAHQSTLASGNHQHYFFGATATLSVGVGDTLFAYVYLDPANPPSEIMLGWNDGSWEHRAYWGANVIPWGVDGTAGRRYMGPLPATGQWVRLEVPAALVGLEGSTLNGMAHILYDGRATWDRAGKVEPTYQLSGVVTLSGAGLTGVSMAATNGASCSNTNASGQYSCTVPQGWTGTVTPTLSGHAFTPPSRSYTNVTANQTAQNYTAAPITFVVSGTVTLSGAGLAGVGMAATNGVSCSNTNASGLYSCTVPYNWTGTVTPALAGYTFTPPSRSYSNVAANQTAQNYAAAPITFVVSGTVTLSGAGLTGVSMAATNGVSCSNTNASGQYSCTVPYNWTGTVTPSLAGYTFTPLSHSYTNVVANQTAQNYAAAPITFVVSGTVTLSGAGLTGVSIAATNGVSCSNTNASGQYSCTVPYNWTGTVTPSLSGYTFTPTSRSYSSVAANQTAQNYTATGAPPPTYQVSGTVTSGGSGLNNVSMAATNGVSCSNTNASGQYSCTVPQGWTGTVTPALAGYTFAPPSRSYSNVTANQTAQNYAGAASSDVVWVEDALPAGATAGTNGVEAWTWVSANPAPFSGALAHQSTLASGNHQHYFFGATATLSVGVGDTLFAYVYLDPANPPSEIMLGWNDGSWEHRAYWGANVIPWGVDGTAGRRYMGPLPATGQWVRLEVPAALVGLEGSTLNGMAHILYDGRATWDRAGKVEPTYQLSGVVTLSGAGLTGVSMAATNGASCSNTNASGQYSCTVPQGWTGTVTPTLSGHAFTPPSRSYTNVTANQTAQNYTAAPITFVVSGTVTLSGAGLAGVGMAATNGVSCSNTNASGLYSCTVPYNWTGTVTPALAGYTFTPPSRSYSNVAANQTAQNYAAAVVGSGPFQVSGTVTLGGLGLAGVSMAATNGVSCSSTNASGQYSCTVPQGWTGTVTPSLSGYTFMLPLRSYTNVAANQTAQDYAAHVGVEAVWVEDALPAGATPGSGVEAWTWVSANPAPFSGALAHQSTLASGNHQHYFFGATATLSVNVGDTLFAYVYLDPANPPSEIMLGWNDGGWEHRAYWGANMIQWGVDGTAGRRYMGPLPPTGQWVRLEVPAALVGLEGITLNGMAHILYDGRATWDRAGKVGTASPVVSLTAPANNATFTAPASIVMGAQASDSDGTITRVEFYWGTTLLHTSTAAPYGFTWTNVPSGSYTLVAKAYDNLGATGLSTPVNVTVTPYAGVPTAADRPTVTRSGTSIQVSWNAVQNATGYTVYASYSASGSSIFRTYPSSANSISIPIADFPSQDSLYFSVAATVGGQVREKSKWAYLLSFQNTDLGFPLRLAIAIADINNDGCVEPLGTLNDCMGNLVPQPYSSIGLSVPATRPLSHGQLADFNGDGIPDLIVNGYSDLGDPNSTILLFYGNGDGTFTQATPAQFPATYGGFGETIVIADFDNDGHLDIFLPNYTDYSSAAQNYLLRNLGNGTFVEIADAAGVALRGWPHEIRVEGAQALDINGDGFLDLYSGSHLYINNGDMTFTDRREQYGLPLFFDEGIKFFDWNNDGHIDLVMHHPDNGPTLFQFNGDYFTIVNDAFDDTYYSASFGMNAEDIDGDGFADVVIAGGLNPDGSNKSASLFLYRNGHYVLSDLLDGPSGIGSISGFADFDNNGTMDMVLAGPTTLRYLKNTAADASSIKVFMYSETGAKNQQGRAIRATPAGDSGFIMTRVVDSGSGYLSNSEYAVTFPTPKAGQYWIRAQFDNGTVSGWANPGSIVKIYRDGRFEVTPR